MIAPNLEYRQGPSEVIPVQSRRPQWPCRETIGDVTYDKETAQRVCRCGDQEIRRTPEGTSWSAIARTFNRAGKTWSLKACSHGSSRQT